ncbi:hypothetical protein [Longispora albida]|uniref:hypothetical protein n=1 Tax=Longispora albida TaxID=203523 RepID=UPI00036D9589|nr:hypothetical protein [Longispora albida]
MRTGRQPNERLRRLLTEAGWAGQDLATAVNTAAAESGLSLTYDRKSVSHWLSGMRPRAPVPALVVEALSRRLQRPVSLAEAGLSAQPAPAAVADAQPGRPQQLDWDESDVVIFRGQQPVTRRKRATDLSSVYSVAALAVPGWPQAQALVRSAPAEWFDEAGRVGTPHAEAAEALLELFHHSDIRSGGGLARRALSAYLAADLLPRLRAPMQGRLRHRVLRVATRLTYLCAFMCFDDEQHGLAQRYYRAALRFAAENDDPGSYAITMRGMSVQARLLGHYAEAVELGEAAINANRYGEPSRMAFIQGQLAVAHAAAQERGPALSCLSAAQRSLDRSTSGAPVGAYHLASLAHQQAAVQAILGDRRRAIAALAESIRHRPAAERRSRAILLARLAELQLQHGHLEEAVASWNDFLDLYPSLRSGRVLSALKALRARIRSYPTHPAARILLRRATGLA